MSSQEIKCGVQSCKFNDRHNMCTLKAIQVSPSPDGSDGTPDGESFCGSYDNKR